MRLWAEGAKYHSLENLSSVTEGWNLMESSTQPTFLEDDGMFAVTILSNTTFEVESVEYEINWPYTALEILVGLVAVIGNGMVIAVFQKERRLRRRTNYYIVSLAIADFLVGLLGIPFAVLASIGLPTNLHACLFTISTLVVLCTISIFCLVAVSVDRYWAILHPMAYSRNVRTKTAIGELAARAVITLRTLAVIARIQNTCNICTVKEHLAEPCIITFL